MPEHRARVLPFDGTLFLTDAGIETTLIFHEGLDLPYFAAFHLLKDQAGREALRRRFPQIAVLGGCCGTDHRHIEQIALNCRLAA